MKIVKDLLFEPNKLKIVFVLESPYKDEIIHGHPLAGRSGKTVTDYIKNHVKKNSIIKKFLRPLGCELYKSNYQKIGIINSSLSPLDKNCYSCQELSDKVECFDLIRRNPNSLKRRIAYHNAIESELLELFSHRVEKIISLNSNITFIPCGDLADKFLNKIDFKALHKIPKLPHPSYNSWNQMDFSELNDLLKGL